jgi:DNA invertase Pin-like site-specific DNA recombinase
MLLGYARVSTDGQELQGQLEALAAAGVEKTYSEKASGADGSRKALAKLLQQARPGDTIVVTRLDRLARSTRDLLNTLDRLGKEGIGFKSLREAAVDTTTPSGKLVISIMAAIAEFERELITSRMKEGRKRAVAKGVKLGPKFRLSPYQRTEALRRLAQGESEASVARSYDVDPSTINRLRRRAEVQ